MQFVVIVYSGENETYSFIIILRIIFVLQSHTILLVQPTKRPEGRTYADYESVNECMEGEVDQSIIILIYLALLPNFIVIIIIKYKLIISCLGGSIF